MKITTTIYEITAPRNVAHPAIINIFCHKLTTGKDMASLCYVTVTVCPLWICCSALTIAELSAVEFPLQRNKCCEVSE